MIPQHAPKMLAGLTALFGCVTAAPAAVIVSVDMDPGTAGIQDILLASAGQSFTVDLVLSVDAAGVSSYSISSVFDTAELSLDGSPAASNNAALPGGLFPLAAPSESNAMGYVYSFNAATFGLGPTSTSFVIGSINFKVLIPVTDGLADITPGFQNSLVDGAFDNGGLPIVPTFVGGKVNVVPEPGSVALLMTGLGGLAIARRRRKG